MVRDTLVKEMDEPVVVKAAMPEQDEPLMKEATTRKIPKPDAEKLEPAYEFRRVGKTMMRATFTLPDVVRALS